MAQAPNFNCSSQPANAFAKVTLTNANGVSASFIPYGATVTNILFPSQSHGPLDIVLGFDDTTQYCANAVHPYFGALIGRVANRIANGSFVLNGATYHTPLNEASAYGGDTLHGGWVGFDRRVWTILAQTSNSVSWQIVSEDGDNGFPGRVTLVVNYTLTDENAWILDYSATTDSPIAVISSTNHAYWNLNANVGGTGTVLDHILSMPAMGGFLETDSTLIPTGNLHSVLDYPGMDFASQPKAVGKDLNNTVLSYGGYDNAFMLMPVSSSTKEEEAARARALGLPPGLSLAASVYSPISGVGMEVWTDQPSLQVYSGNFLDGTLPRKASQGGPSATYQKHGALAMEAQGYVDAVHHPNWPPITLVPGQVYRQTTAYRFFTV